MSFRLTPRARNWGLIVGALVLVALADRLAPKPEIRSIYFDLDRPMIIAHQGGAGVRPSNTLVAFQHAMDLGADVLEMDVHLTRDGALVLMHDATVERTTDGSGALAEMTLAQVTALDAAYHWPHQGNEWPYRGRGVRVPTLAEVLERYPQARINIEIKPPTAQAGRAVCDELERWEAQERALVASFHAEAMEAFRAACPTVPTSAFESEVRRLYLQYRLGLWRFAQPEAAALQLPARANEADLMEPQFLAAAGKLGLHVDFWTVNDPAQARELLRRGAGGIITDRPDRILAALGRLPAR